MGTLEDTALSMVAPRRGILAADESIGTMSRRLAAVGVPGSVEHRRAWRRLIIDTPGLRDHVSGIILNDETFWQDSADGTPIPEAVAVAGMLPGVKVDTGAEPLAGHPGETVTEGLDRLRHRLARYAEHGARFAKWRAVIGIGDARPTSAALSANAHALARYAALCQEAGVVPVVEPDVLMDGDHDLAVAEAVTGRTLRVVFDALAEQDVLMEGVVLKPSMVLAGERCAVQPGPDEVAAATLRCLLRTVPAAVPGVAFLSGGQSPARATANLQALNAQGRQPWQLTFSFGRGLLEVPLGLWQGEPARVAEAQTLLAHRARCNAAARDGRYSEALEAA